MINTIKRNLIIGLLASFVPIYMTSYKFINNCTKNGINYPQLVRNTPIIFAILNIILIPLFNYFNINNWFIIGAIFSIIYSSMGRFISGIPTKVFELENPNYFHLYALIIWTLFYGFFIQYII